MDKDGYGNAEPDLVAHSHAKLHTFGVADGYRQSYADLDLDVHAYSAPDFDIHTHSHGYTHDYEYFHNHKYSQLFGEPHGNLYPDLDRDGKRLADLFG